MDTVLTILIFGFIGVSVLIGVAAITRSTPSRGRPREDGRRVDPIEVPYADPEPVDEVRAEAVALVEARNARRRRRGEAPLNVDDEVAVVLRSLGEEPR